MVLDNLDNWIWEIWGGKMTLDQLTPHIEIGITCTRDPNIKVKIIKLLEERK